jgi:hypothetical protein
MRSYCNLFGVLAVDVVVLAGAFVRSFNGAIGGG